MFISLLKRTVLRNRVTLKYPTRSHAELEERRQRNSVIFGVNSRSQFCFGLQITEQ